MTNCLIYARDRGGDAARDQETADNTQYGVQVRRSTFLCTPLIADTMPI